MGVFEILIVAVIALVVFGGYFRKQLPQFGRSAGKNARIGGEKAKELADQASGKASEVGEKVGDRFDPGDMGRTAGKHVREAREFRDSFKGTLNPMAESEAKPKPEAAATPASEAKPAPEAAVTPAPEATPPPAPAAGAAPEAAAKPVADAEPEIETEPEVGERAADPAEVEEAPRRSADGHA